MSTKIDFSNCSPVATFAPADKTLNATSVMALFTGSRVYGTPTDRSDVDLVILVDEATAQVLHRLADNTEDYDSVVRFSLKFGKLNLIVETKPAAMATWMNGTKELLDRAPVTRAAARQHFAKLRDAQAKVSK